jgi:hypothetical protein
MCENTKKACDIVKKGACILHPVFYFLCCVLPAVAQSQHFVLPRLQLQNILRIFGKILCRLQAAQKKII